MHHMTMIYAHKQSVVCLVDKAKISWKGWILDEGQLAGSGAMIPNPWCSKKDNDVDVMRYRSMSVSGKTICVERFIVNRSFHDVLPEQTPHRWLLLIQQRKALRHLKVDKSSLHMGLFCFLKQTERFASTTGLRMQSCDGFWRDFEIISHSNNK